MPPSAYLAGPEVFLPDAADIFAQKKIICAQYGLVGIAPLDNEVPQKSGRSAIETANLIFKANEEAMRGCVLGIANITPFRGVSADPGTVYEIGFLRGLGKLVLGYTNDERDYAERVRSAGLSGPVDATDQDGLTVELFGLGDNLMIPNGIEASGGAVFAQNVEDETLRLRDLGTFKAAAAFAARKLGL